MYRRWLSVALWLAVAVARAQAQHEGAPPPAPGTFTPDELRADVAAFRTGFMARDKSFSVAARESAEVRIAALERALDTISFARFDVEIAQIAALADNGHTHTAAGAMAMRHRRVNVRVAPFGQEFFVLRAADADTVLLGARLVAIDGHGMAELRAAARTLAGGTVPWRDRFANVLFESPELLHAMGLTRSPTVAVYRFVLGSGAVVERRLEAAMPTPTTPSASPSRWLSSDPLPTEPATWRALRAGKPQPWALQEGGEPFRWRRAPEVNGAVVQLRRNFNAGEIKLLPWLRQVADSLRAIAPVNVVLDMRENGGGDLNLARDFMKALPTIATGRVVVLTSPYTFSAAISSVGYLKQAGGDQVVIVGEMLGDRLEFWAEGRGTELPNTKIGIGLATERHDYRTGCKGFTDCHRSVVFAPIAVASLAPDVEAPWTFEAYLAGRDPGMEAAIALLGRR